MCEKEKVRREGGEEELERNCDILVGVEHGGAKENR